MHITGQRALAKCQPEEFKPGMEFETDEGLKRLAGEAHREYLGNITVTESALKLGVNRVTLSRVLTGSAGVSADMAYRLGESFQTSPELWAGMQLQYDLYQAGKLKRPKIGRMAA